MTEIFCEFPLEIAHSLPRMPEWHKCRRVHGHSYRVRVTITGNITDDRGMILDYAEIEEIWAKQIFARLDHQNINDALDSETTTSEYVAEWIGSTLLRALPADLVSVELWETRCFGARWTPPRISP